MSGPIPASPLSWPTGWRRTEPQRRDRARFGKASRTRQGDGWDSGRQLTISEGVARIREQFRMMGIEDDDIERHGGAVVLERAFSGFTALPGPSTADWRKVLDPADPEGSYRRLRSKHHPDRAGGSQQEFHRVQLAWTAYCEETGHGAN